jgi:prolyl 4-hydroxylase
VVSWSLPCIRPRRALLLGGRPEVRACPPCPAALRYSMAVWALLAVLDHVYNHYRPSKMPSSWASTAVTLTAGIGLGVLPILFPRVQDFLSVDAGTLSPTLLRRIPLPWARHRANATEDVPFVCGPSNYTTQFVSLDPLIIYIRDFLHPAEMDGILAATEHLLKPSTVTRYGQTVESEYRTSWSAEIPPDVPAAACVDARVWDFMGAVLGRGKDAVEPPQVVRYRPGQKFDVHHDWYERPQPEWRGRRRAWNRVASFFAILEDDCTGGETYFPHVDAFTPHTPAAWDAERAGGQIWRRHEDGGLAFRPVRGNALFWINLHPNRTGDVRVEHAGLPVQEGLKTAMNIWPRVYIGPDAWDYRPASDDTGV